MLVSGCSSVAMHSKAVSVAMSYELRLETSIYLYMIKLSLISPIRDFNLPVITAALPMKALARSQSALSVSSTRRCLVESNRDRFVFVVTH